MEKKPTSSAVMGLLVGLILIVCSLVIYFTQLYLETWGQYIGFVLLFGVILVSVLLHSNEVAHQTTFGKLFGFGFKVTAAATVSMIVFVVLQGMIFPDIKTRFMEVAREGAYKHPEAAANKDAIEQNLQMVEKNFTFIIILGILFWYLVIGAIASLVGAAVAKKKPVVAEFDNI
jgi:hypothetical protein